MTFQLNPEFADQEARNRISKLEEQMLRQNNRIASLETRVWQHQRTASELVGLKEEIGSLHTTITEQKEENAAHFRSNQQLLSRLASVENCEEELKELKKQMMERPLLPPLGSIERDILELKTTLIEKSILAERSVFLKDDRFDGIIACLTRNCGGNVSDRGIVEIRSKSFLNDNRLPKNAADFAWSSPNFVSKNEVDQWIEWDFKTSQIEPTHYSIRTHGRKAGDAHLQNWVIEGRNEEKKWTQLDERRNNLELIGRSCIATFEIATRFRIRVRILRLRQIALNHRGNHVLAFNSFELFGELFRHSSRKEINQSSLIPTFCLTNRMLR
jgi:hypothetical protein